MSNFRPVDRETGFLLPPSVEEWLPERHLARFVVEVIVTKWRPKLERRQGAFRFIAANDHPDHDTIAAFRRRFLDRIEGLFVEVLLLAREAGVLISWESVSVNETRNARTDNRY